MKRKLGPTLESIGFFKANAGFSYNPKTETKAQGMDRCARRLAAAEQWAREAGYSFSWEVDCIDSSEWSGETPPWPQYLCVIRNGEGVIVGSLGGVDFGRDGTPWNNPYRRVVEAELALEEMPAELLAA